MSRQPRYVTYKPRPVPALRDVRIFTKPADVAYPFTPRTGPMVNLPGHDGRTILTVAQARLHDLGFTLRLFLHRATLNATTATRAARQRIERAFCRIANEFVAGCSATAQAADNHYDAIPNEPVWAEYTERIRQMLGDLERLALRGAELLVATRDLFPLLWEYPDFHGKAKRGG